MTILHRISQGFPQILRSPDDGGGSGGAPAGGSSGSSGAPSSAAAGAPASSPPAQSNPGSGSPTAPGTSPAPGSESRSPSPSPPTGNPPSQTPPGAPASGEGAGDTFNFDQIFTVRDPLTDLTGPEVTPPPEPAAPATQQPQTEQPPAPQAPAAPAPSPTAASQAPAPAAQSTESPSSVVLSDPETLSVALRQNEAAAIEHIAQHAFSLSQQEIEALEADVVGTLPKLMAKVMVKTQQSFFSNLGKIVPAMLQAHNQSATRNKEAEDQFFGAWPDLNKPELKEVVARTAKAFRMANPQVPREQMIREVGIIVSHMSGVAIRQQNAQPGTGAPQAPAAPAANGHRPVQPSPWVPAGAGPAGAGTAEEGSPWDILGQSEG